MCVCVCVWAMYIQGMAPISVDKAVLTRLLRLSLCPLTKQATNVSCFSDQVIIILGNEIHTNNRPCKPSYFFWGGVCHLCRTHQLYTDIGCNVDQGSPTRTHACDPPAIQTYGFNCQVCPVLVPLSHWLYHERFFFHLGSELGQAKHAHC